MSLSIIFLALLMISSTLVSGQLTSGSICGGCANSTQCYDFGIAPSGKYLGCFGTFSGGGPGLVDVCADHYTSTTVADAIADGFTATMCDLSTDDIVFFFNEGFDSDDDLCPSDGGTANQLGLFGCISTASSLFVNDACDDRDQCGSVALYLCDRDEGDYLGDGGDGTYLTMELFDPTYGGAICVRGPTFAPSEVPSEQPSEVPSAEPSEFPTTEPSEFPTTEPSEIPSFVPTTEPSEFPSEYPTMMPSDPTFGPSFVPTSEPTSMPSVPTIVPSKQPSDMPTDTLPPTRNPSSEPSDLPSVSPSDVPTTQPSDEPTTYPSLGPTNQPTDEPTNIPTGSPIEVEEGTGTKEDSGLIGSLSDELSILIIVGAGCLLLILVAVIAVCIKKRKNEKSTQGGNSTEMAGVAFKVHSDGATPNNSHYHEDKDEFHISNMTPK